MAQVKAHEVDRVLAKPDPKFAIFLLYGPDSGLVSERATLLARSSGVSTDDPFSTVRLDADDAAAEPTRIADEAFTVSMFGDKRLVWISGSTRRNLMKSLEPVLETRPDGAMIIVEAGDLKKSAPLRTRIEKCAHAVALPCYQDQAKALDAIIDEEMKAAGLTIEPEARSTLKSLLGGDRLASRGEVKKLCLYAHGQGTVTDEDVAAIAGDAAGLDVDAVVDAASVGDIETMEHTFKRLIARGTSTVQIVLALQRHFQMLHLARATMEAKRQPPASVVGAMRPPVNFQRRDKVVRALGLWREKQLLRTLDRLNSVSLESRSKAALSVPLVSTALLAIAIEARRAGR